MIQISFIRTEGLPNEPELILKKENTEIPPLNNTQDPTFILQSPGHLNLTCRFPAKKDAFSSSFHSSLLPAEGFQWIPLSKNEIFTVFPEEVSCPKILILVSSDFSSVLDKISENECEACELTKAENNRLQSEILKMTKEANSKFDTLTAENEKNKLLVKKFSALYNECKKELQFYRDKFEEERKKCNEVSEKLKNLSCRLENNWKPRPASTSPAFNGLKGSMSSLNLKRKPLSELNQSQKSLKETDRALKKFLTETNMSGLIRKDKSNNYMFGNKKVLITLRKGNLMCRVGGGFEGIQDFLNKNKSDSKTRPNSIFANSHKRNLTADEVKELETEEKAESRAAINIEKMLKLRIRPNSTSFIECS